jgi:hypothetical protein
MNKVTLNKTIDTLQEVLEDLLEMNESNWIEQRDLVISYIDKLLNNFDGQKD